MRQGVALELNSSNRVYSKSEKRQGLLSSNSDKKNTAIDGREQRDGSCYVCIYQGYTCLQFSQQRHSSWRMWEKNQDNELATLKSNLPQLNLG